jgi:hypothetical protein
MKNIYKTLVIAIICFVLGLSLGFVIGGLREKGIYVSSGVTASGNRYTIYKTSDDNSVISEEDVTGRVQIVCYSGNKKTFEAKETGLKFAENDFDANKQFVNHEKNGEIQKICETTQKEKTEWLGKFDSGANVTSLFDVDLKS